MKMMPPIQVTDSSLTSSSVAEADHAAWSSGVTYATGDKVILTTGYHRIYESLADGNTGNNPATTTGYWVDIGPTNRWAMFDLAVGTVTEDTDEIEVVIALSNVEYANCLALLDVVGDIALLEIIDDEENVLWSRELELKTFGLSGADWYWYFFSDLEQLDSVIAMDIPRFYDSSLRVTITGTGTVGCGTLAFGQAEDIGITEWGPRLGLHSYSTKETDPYGVTTVVSRGYSKVMECDFFFPHAWVRQVFRKLAEVRDTPVLWIGSDEPLFDVMIVYGFAKNFEITLRTPRGSWCALEVEGLV